MTNEYANSDSLNARAQIYRFCTAKQDWLAWVFDQLDLPSESCILEIGCGNGDLWASNSHLTDSTWQITLTDSSSGMLQEARSKLGDLDCITEFQLAEAESLPYPDQCFDVVIANHMLYHVPNLDKAFSEIHRVLRAGGRLHASTNGKSHLRELHDLVFDIAPSMGSSHDALVEHFGLENGGDQLRRYFPHVELRRHEGDLEVTDAQSVIDYMLSIPASKSSLTGDAIERIGADVRSEIHRRGRMRITRDVGLFIAYKDK